MKHITTLRKGFLMNIKHISLCLLLLTCNVTFSELQDFSPGDEDFLDPVEQKNSYEDTTQQQGARLLVIDKKKSAMLEECEDAITTLRKEGRAHLDELNEKYGELFAQNQDALNQNQQEMREAIAQALDEHRAVLDKQKQMSSKEHKALKERTEEKIAQIIGRFDNDKAQFISVLLQSKETEIAYKERLIVTREEHNGRRRNLMFGGFICSVVLNLFFNYFPPSKKAADSDSQEASPHESAVLSARTFISSVPRVVIVYGLCLGHKDTEFLQADVAHERRGVEQLQAMLNFLKQKADKQGGEAAQEQGALPGEVPGAVIEEQVAADEIED